MKKSSHKRTHKDYLLDVEDAINKIERFSAGFGFKKFSEDEKTQEAIVRKFEIIGEAAKNIPAKIKNGNKQIPWAKMYKMRNKMVHEYFGVNKKVVWNTIKQDVPELKKQIDNLLKELKINKLI